MLNQCLNFMRMSGCIAVKILSVFAAMELVDGAYANTMYLHGMNWACAANNYGALPWPDGIIGNENHAQAFAVGRAAGNWALSQGGNILRLPVEPPMTAVSANWSLYTNVINGVVATGCKVILCYWTPDSYVTNTSQWYGMWDTVNASYASATNVLYEPGNEPASQANLNDLYAGFVAR
jgi:hypothetical protein